MHHLFYLMGKSASGKDTIYQELQRRLALRPLILHTTRPRRADEQDGREYYFIGQKELEDLRRSNSLIEERTYHTKEGDWTYCTAKSAVDPAAGSCLGIGTLESYRKLRACFGAETVIPLYIEVEDGIRLQRALDRERTQSEPKYAEMCRRFLTDTEDFSEAQLQSAGIVRRFQNLSLEACIAELEAYIRGML